MSSSQTPYASMRRIILASMILAPLSVFLLALGIGFSFFAASIEHSTRADMKRVALDQRRMIDSFLSERRSDLEFVLRGYDFKRLRDPGFLREVFRNLKKKSRAFVDLGVFDRQGIHVAYEGPYQLAGKPYKDAEWFREVVERGCYISDVFLGYRNVPHFIIAVAQGEGEDRWVLRATIDTHVFSQLVEGVRIGRTGEAFLLNREGLFQTIRRSGGGLMEKDPDVTEVPASRDSIRTYIRRDASGKACLYATAWLNEKAWILVVRQARSDAFGALRTATLWIVGILILGGAGILGMAFYLTGRIISRMERKDMEKDRLNLQLIRASRLAELGEMAAGFAHEINNPLQIVHVEQALIGRILYDMKNLGSLTACEDVREIENSLAQTKTQLDRCARITGAILKFARKGEPAPKDLDLGSFVDEVTAMIEKKATMHGIEIRKYVAPDVPLVHGDPLQLQQVFINLFNNAIDAIIEKRDAAGGRLVVEAARVDENAVAVYVIDNGVGISAENVKRIFAPFFTTKPVGKGTGLGLSVCYRIIKSMGGEISVESEEGAGTMFTIRLPGEC